MHKMQQITQEKSGIVELRYFANLWLQMLLWSNVFISLKWAKLYAFQLWYHFNELNNTHGAFIIGTFLIALIVEYWRLYSGYAGNLRGRSADLSTLLIVSPIIQAPLLLLLRFMAKGLNLWIDIVTAMLLLLILLQLIVCASTWRNLVQQQQIYFKLKQQQFLQQQHTLQTIY